MRTEQDRMVTTLTLVGGLAMSNVVEEGATLVCTGRVEKAGQLRWQKFLHELLESAEQAPWSVDVSLAYFLSEDKSLKYNWRLIFQGPWAGVLTRFEPRSQTPLEELELVPAPVRGVSGTGKGIQPADPSAYTGGQRG
jgi:hypothetical protein